MNPEWNTGALPDNLDELAHVDVVWHQELGLVQDGKLFFTFIPLNDHLQAKADTESVSPLLFWLVKFYEGNISCAVFRPDTLTAEQCP